MARRVFANRIFNPRMGQSAALQGVGPVAGDVTFGGAPVGRIRLPSRVRPSYKNGFARSAAESMFPDLWPTHAWVPMLGPTGFVLPDVGSNVYTMQTYNMEANDWGVFQGEQRLQFGGGNEYAEVLAAPMSPPFTVHAYFSQPTGVAAYAWSQAKSDGQDLFSIGCDNFAGKRVFFGVRETTTTFDKAYPTTNYVPNTWVNVTGVAHSSTDRRCYQDGGFEGQDTTDKTPTGLDNMWLGGIGDDVPNYRFITLGCVLLYDRALTLGEIATLGHDPLAPFRLMTRVPMQVGTSLIPPAGTWVADTRSQAWLTGQRTQTWCVDTRSQAWVTPNRNEGG